MKILIVHPQMKLYGGAELVITRLAYYLQSCGDSVDILTLSTDSHEDYEGLNIVTPPEEIEYRLRGSVGTLNSLMDVYGSLSRLCRFYCKYRHFDIINPHNFPAIWTVPKSDNIVWLCNEIPDLWHNRKVNPILNRMLDLGRLLDGYIAFHKKPLSVVADGNVAEIFKQRYRMSPEIIPYGIEGQYFSKRPSDDEIYEVKRNYGISDSDFNIIYPAMISPSKNQLALLEALNRLDKDGIKDIKVILTGYSEPDFPYTKLLHDYVREKNLSDRVLFAGIVPKKSFKALYYLSSLAVFCGIGQGSWLSPFEVLSCGVPIIVSPRLTCSYLVKFENLGVVSSDLVESIKEIRNNYIQYKTLALRGKDYVLSELTWERYGERVRGLFERVQK